MEKGTLYLIPTSLSGKPLTDIYPESILDILRTLDHIVVETPKIGRSFLKGLNPNRQTSSLTFYELNENNRNSISDVITTLLNGHSVGVMSDAGYPAIGDMGADLVMKAHISEINVITFHGPSSILQSLASSGLGGQNFKFNGYLPKDQEDRRRKILAIERRSSQENQTEIFIETPYRAQYIFEDILSICKPTSMLSMGINIEMADQKYITKTIREFRNMKLNLNKQQVVFILKA